MDSDAPPHPRGGALRVTYVFLALFFMVGAAIVAAVTDDALAGVTTLGLLALGYGMSALLSSSAHLLPRDARISRNTRRLLITAGGGAALLGVVFLLLPDGSARAIVGWVAFVAALGCGCIGGRELIRH